MTSRGLPSRRRFLGGALRAGGGLLGAALVPRPAASITLTSVRSISRRTVPMVSGTSVSGTKILAIISVPGAVMITAVSRWLASMPNRM